mmetsp:Transcript_2017/g.4251  ORF Transcript_2017/g.4251 Transcript_2017/m.4251 type:complete len:87 (+) Transcript_2017:1095-1355(+)
MVERCTPLKKKFACAFLNEQDQRKRAETKVERSICRIRFLVTNKLKLSEKTRGFFEKHLHRSPKEVEGSQKEFSKKRHKKRAVRKE